MIELVAPEGFSTNPPGVIAFPDGGLMRKKPNGRWDFDDNRYSHLLAKFEMQGWRKYEEPKPKPQYRDELDRLVHEQPLTVREIMQRLAHEEVQIRREGSRLQMRPLRGGISAELRRYVEHSASALLNELDRRRAVQWEVIG